MYQHTLRDHFQTSFAAKKSGIDCRQPVIITRVEPSSAGLVFFLKKEKKPGFDQRLEKGNITHDDAFTSAVNNLSTSVCFLTIARLAPMSALQFFCCLLAFLFLYRCNQDKLFVINRWMCCEKQRSWYNLCGRYNLISVRSNDKILLNKTQSTIF